MTTAMTTDTVTLVTALSVLVLLMAASMTTGMRTVGVAAGHVFQTCRGLHR